MTTVLKNDLLLRALRRQPVPRTPVWIMRQAGRYLPEYRAVREQAGDFMSLCSNPELACEVTLQPLRRFKLDAAILFSDILTIPDALGLELYFETGEGPKFRKPLRNSSDIRRIAPIDIESRLQYVFAAVALIRQQLAGEVPLIGFSGSPWTVATYMVEGGSSRDFPRTLGLAKEQPALLDELLSTLVSKTTNYLNAQIESGAQAIQIFDTWGGALEGDDYRRYSLEPMQRILDGLIRERDGHKVPVILFTKGAGERLATMADTGCDALGVDWTTTLAEARDYTADKVALQGNLNPAVLKESHTAIREGVAGVLASYGTGPGHVFNLGHGITPDVKPEHLGVLVDAVHELSPAYHSE
ncbi:uroporphyrinogen decarboxylase [Woeseia oceani]|uniref:Uroporphyrinogen decarboxylase n=1 Tax=Woeseia oceani TaxID=1548547 RepID=A0A193LK77_9GAMM|nr:uroporphyrinogen decarboxylase [Woeseia oceani]ANO52804.1 uroporphyrinogen decarboxylase [Woeseia oceani]